MMSKGKGYLDHVKPKGKGFGDPFKEDAIGSRSMRAALAEWPEKSWKQPKPKKKMRKNKI